MIDQKEGETNFAVKIHYDDMVSIQKYKKKNIYFILKNTHLFF